MRAHGLMARALREHDRADADGDGHATRVGIAQNLRLFDAYSLQPGRTASSPAPPTGSTTSRSWTR